MQNILLLIILVLTITVSIDSYRNTKKIFKELSHIKGKLNRLEKAINDTSEK